MTLEGIPYFSRIPERRKTKHDEGKETGEEQKKEASGPGANARIVNYFNRLNECISGSELLAHPA
ncbi:MAG: hypothetical protein ACXW32_13715 [Limisphaerales bacterium]